MLFDSLETEKDKKSYLVGIVNEFIQSSEKICNDERPDLIAGQMIRIVPMVWPE